MRARQGDDNMKTAVSTTELNAWILEAFSIYRGPARSYLDIPIQCKLLVEGQVVVHDFSIRRPYITLGLHGVEEDCVAEIQALMLKAIPFDEERQDRNVPLFIRADFYYDPLSSTVRGRLAFLDETKNAVLRADRAYAQDGYCLREAQRRETC